MENPKEFTVKLLALILVFMGFNISHQYSIRNLDNTTATGFVSEVLCDHNDKCTAILSWDDTKEREIITFRKSEHLPNSRYTVNIKLDIRQKLGIFPSNLPNLERFKSANSSMNSIGALNGLVLFAASVFGLFGVFRLMHSMKLRNFKKQLDKLNK